MVAPPEGLRAPPCSRTPLPGGRHGAGAATASASGGTPLARDRRAATAPASGVLSIAGCPARGWP
eukprot:724730-Lingulodinium_polyedra.AAC.1